jgi:hypothetical protein
MVESYFHRTPPPSPIPFPLPPPLIKGNFFFWLPRKKSCNSKLSLGSPKDEVGVGEGGRFAVCQFSDCT